MPNQLATGGEHDAFTYTSIFGDRFRSMSVSTNANTEFSTVGSSVFRDYQIHKEMLALGSSALTRSPLLYIKYSSLGNEVSLNSSRSNVSASAAAYYDAVERNLISLSRDPKGDERVEKGAVTSALTVVDQLRKSQIAPPELSWHGGDAVVMLWALGDTTYAITVTDGELGYVVRRNRKAVKMADSYQISSFRIQDLR